MTHPRVAEIGSRALIHVTGEEAAGFLDRVVTADVDAIPPLGAGYGALLTPQGKVIADFLLVRLDDGFLVDAPKAAGADLARRLALYRLRAKVAIEDVTDRLAVLAVWGLDGPPPAMPGRLVRDPRHDALGWRAYVARAAIGPAEAFPGADIEDEEAWQAHRAGLAIPEAGRDFALGEAFPHEIAMDALSGVSFDKGCYVGQEVVSRMQHRGTARRRPSVVTADGPLPEAGAEILADGRPAGSLGSAAGNRGTAILRLDRIREAAEAGRPVTCGGVPVTVSLPDWATWDWPAGGDG